MKFNILRFEQTIRTSLLVLLGKNRLYIYLIIEGMKLTFILRSNVELEVILDQAVTQLEWLIVKCLAFNIYTGDQYTHGRRSDSDVITYNVVMFAYSSLFLSNFLTKSLCLFSHFLSCSISVTILFDRNAALIPQITVLFLLMLHLGVKLPLIQKDF